MIDEPGADSAVLPAVADRDGWQGQLDDLLVREKAHTREGDAIAAARRRLPLYLRHIVYFIRGLRPPAAGWTVTAMTVLVAGALPLAGQGWLPSFFAVAVSLLVVLPWRWSLPGVAALALAQAPLALAFPLAAPAAIPGAPYYSSWWS